MHAATLLKKHELTLVDCGHKIPSMSITAVVEDGLIKLPKDVPWSSGTVVRIEPAEQQTPTLLDALKEFDGMADDSPADLVFADVSDFAARQFLYLL
jgi:hypothetical protein